jgi:Flp pilus assembly protein TadG
MIRARSLTSSHTLLRRFIRNEDGVTAIELALVFWPFLLFIFGALEIALVVLFGALLDDGANEAAHYLRDETMKCVRQGTATNNCSAATIEGVRAAICGKISLAGMYCDTTHLKLAIYAADSASTLPASPTTMIDQQSIDLQSARSSSSQRATNGRSAC